MTSTSPWLRNRVGTCAPGLVLLFLALSACSKPSRPPPTPYCETELAEAWRSNSGEVFSQAEAQYVPAEAEARAAATLLVLLIEASQSGWVHPALYESDLIYSVSEVRGSYPSLFEVCGGQQGSPLSEGFDCERSCGDVFDGLIMDRSKELLLEVVERIGSDRFRQAVKAIKDDWNAAEAGWLTGRALATTDLEDIGRAVAAALGVASSGAVATVITAGVLLTDVGFDFLNAKLEFDDCATLKGRLCDESCTGGACFDGLYALSGLVSGGGACTAQTYSFQMRVQNGRAIVTQDRFFHVGISAELEWGKYSRDARFEWEGGSGAYAFGAFRAHASSASVELRTSTYCGAERLSDTLFHGERSEP